MKNKSLKEGPNLGILKQTVSQAIDDAVEAGKTKVDLNLDNLFLDKLVVDLQKDGYSVTVISRDDESTVQIDWTEA